MAAADTTAGALSPSSRRELGRTGILVSPLGFGAAPLGHEYGPIEEQGGIDAVHAALRQGINYFDTSPYYGRGRSEEVLGRALRSLPRDSFVVGTKVGRYGVSSFDFSAARVTRSVDESLQRLGLQFADVVLCHDVEFGDLHQIATETIPALQRLKAAGKVRAVGVSAYPVEVFPYIVAAAPPRTIDVVLSYCNYCLQSTRLAPILGALQREGVAVVNASPLSMGLLTGRGPPDWHPAPSVLRERARVASEMCERRGVPLAAVALRWALDAEEGKIASTLVGIKDTETLRMNIETMGREVDRELVEEVREIFGETLNMRWDSGRFLA